MKMPNLCFMKNLFLYLSLLVSFTTTAFAQEFEIKKFDLNATIVPAEYKVDVKARLQLVNLSGPDLADKILLSTTDKPRLSFYLNAKAKVEGMKINDASVTIKTSEDERNNLLRVHTDITSTIASAREFNVDIVYSIPSIDRSTSLHISNGDVLLLPSSFWYPVIHTPYAGHGADTAPVSLTVAAPAGLKLVSSGIRKSENSFEQSMAAQPFFLAGDYEVLTRGGESYPIELYFPRGVSETGKQQALRLVEEAERIISFYVKYFGVAALAPFRIIASPARQLSTATTDTLSQSREVTFATVGAVTLDDTFFRRDTLDLGTIELLSAAAARSWIDGQVLLRGLGTGMLRDSLPVYLATQYLGVRYGAATIEEAFERYRRSYGSIARNDAPLLMQSPIDRNYTTSVYNKGALVWRLMEKQVGKEKFDEALRASLTRSRVDVLSLNEWKSPLCALSRCVNFKSELLRAGANGKIIDEIFTNWIDTVLLPDFAIGQPQKTANGFESTVTNFGEGDMTIDVQATTDKGEKLRQSVTLRASEYRSVTFPANVNITTVEADPEKLFLQSNYANDASPRRPSDLESYGKANIAFSKNDFAGAEALAREALKANVNAPTLQALLGRAMLAQNKRDEALQVFTEVLKTEPLPIQAYGWAHLGLGEIAMQQNKAAEASRHYRLAAAADIDAATTIAARDGALKAESGTAKIPEEIQQFLQKFDAAVLLSTADAINPFVELGSLRSFARSLVVRKPSIWVTTPLGAEEWDATRTAVDVKLRIKIENEDYTGRAVYVISRSGGKMRLSEVPVFDVK
jgi:tetratricopeptide (TPR) repeat protein